MNFFKRINKTVASLPATWRAAALTLTLSGGLVGGDYLSRLGYLERRKIANVTHETIGKPKLGGPWTLVDGTTGEPVTSEDMIGKYMLLYFGFTYCPDICPQELEKVSEVLMKLESDNIIAVFVTIDPRRDSCTQVADYVKSFPGRFIALTGTPSSIKRISRLFRVYYNDGIKTTENDYLIDHSIIHYLVGPSGEFIDFYGKNLTAQEMVEKIESSMKK